jgi:hypothetical protein
MRIITLVCGLLLLASCREATMSGGGDSSPIIISDGSISVKLAKPNADFSVKQAKHGEIEIVNHAPTALGYLCDPSSKPVGTACPSTTPCPAKPTAACKVDLTGLNSWDLSLCDTDGNSCKNPGLVSVTWRSNKTSLINIDSHQNNFGYGNGSGASGGELKHGPGPLKGGTLDVKPPHTYPTYTFDCPGQCLTLAYEK